jgi:hypothetical protein
MEGVIAGARFRLMREGRRMEGLGHLVVIPAIFAADKGVPTRNLADVL